MPGAGTWVDRGQRALRAGDWTTARDCFQASLGEAETPEALDGLGRALYWLGDYAPVIGLLERGYAGFRACGETRYPSRIACLLSFLHAGIHGNQAACSGWLERGKNLAEASGDCVERGWAALYSALLATDPDQKERHAVAAMAHAQRHTDTDLHFDALAYLGECLVERGQVGEGMRRLDEAVAAATSGEVRDPIPAGEIYCKMLIACETAMDVRRAEQWMAVVHDFVRRSHFTPISAICRMYYGAILTASGRWPEAEAELTAAIQIYDSGYRGLRSGAIARLADLRVRQGRLEEAAQLVTGYEHDPYAVRPIARLHLIRGEYALAENALRRHRAQLGVSRTGARALPAPLHALLVEVTIATGRLDEARRTTALLQQAAARTSLPLTAAFAAFAAGITSRAAGDDETVGHLERALAGFTAAGLPLEAARTRLELGRALSSTAPQLALAEARAALTTLESLRAAHDVDAAAQLLRQLGAPTRTWPKSTGTLSPRETEVLWLVADGLSNDAIAQRLFLSKRTVEHHIGNILAKLGLQTRAEACAYAARHADTRSHAGLPGSNPVAGRTEAVRR
jgi:DNA-binding NarL/FixJ family response regulator